MIKVSDFIAMYLAEKYQVSHVFLIPGGGAMHLNDSFGNTKGIEYIVNHHEQASAISAEAYARTSGKLGVVNVTSGPGGLNTLTGVMGQWTDSVPVLYISGQIKQETSIYSLPHLKLRQLGDQEADIISVVKPITKFAEMIKEPKMVKYYLDKAIHIAKSGRPGPVWLDVPLDVQGAMVDEKTFVEFSPDEVKIKTSDISTLDQVIALIKKSQRPVLVAGHGVRIAKAQPELYKLIELLNIPVVTTFNGIDIVESNHPLYMGRIGTLGSRGANFTLQNSDLMISVGSRNNIRQISYNWKSYARAAKKVIVDIDENEIKKPFLIPDVPVIMDARQFLVGMLEKINKSEIPNFSEWVKWCSVRRDKYPIVQKEWCEVKNGINPYVFVEKLTQKLREGDVVVTGNGTACVAGFQASIVKKNQRYFWNSGCATMGYDLPAAIGASLATNRGPVMCLSGDGSFMMNMQEMETIAYQKLPIKIFLLNNDGYISMRQTQNSFFEGRLTGADPSSGVGFPKFINLAKAFNFETIIIDSIIGIEEKIDYILNYNGPIFCEVILPKDYKFEPKLSSIKLPDGRMISKPLEDLSPLLDRKEFAENMIIPLAEE